ncbi:dehydrodolichyl diphosphate synthase complex subunit nus1 [Trichoplusia ni]|uniref:ditrans,polycis-polyprenyl diphosphate synthase [(2E,6E)-farnesyldiphosphate specific] n=1 Tax=Trichoplusia ni TaxID=7111 RepID=A0A7E5WUK1_TRINI|nr:dehydrodolichyl diphosphate synthase complex subunit nus1 [Trichoplusia ni]
MLSRLLSQVLLTLVHLVVNILVAVQNVYSRIRNKKCTLHQDEVTKSDIKVILENVPRVTKKLKHLVILTDTDHHSLSDLSRMVIWSLVAGISYVSFYDLTGRLKENEEKLFLEVERNKKGVPGCIKWYNKPDLNGYTNGMQAHTVYINIFTSEDGRPTIAQCIRRIAEDKVVCSRESSEYTAQELDSALMLMYPSIPDPDLVLYTGPRCCTHGLLPWQIRLTEFIQLSVNHSVNINNYVGALYRYNKCDQRFGK